MQDFFSMGGHGIYIWPAYAITAIVLLANVFISNTQLTNRLKKIALLGKSKLDKERKGKTIEGTESNLRTLGDQSAETPDISDNGTSS